MRAPHQRLSYSLETSFTDNAHRGALRCVSVSSNGILAASSTDESVRVHSLKRRKEIGGLFEHSGTVNCIVFHKTSVMFSASDDRTVCVWKTKNWELLRTLKGHKAPVLSVAVHPSGKLALSVGSDKSLLTWDLVTGKLAFQRKLKEAAQKILFTPCGDHYILVYQNSIEVCAVTDTQVVKELDFTWRINAVSHIQDNTYAVGGDEQQVLVMDFLTGERILTLDMAPPGKDSFSGRVRGLSFVCTQEENTGVVFVGTSTGDIKAFQICLTKGKERSQEILNHSAGVRLTCLTVYSSCKSEGKENVASKSVSDVNSNDHVKGDSDEEEEEEERTSTVDQEDEESEESHQGPPKSKKRKKKEAQKKQKEGKKRNKKSV